ncbi:MAG: hypothetical protein ABH846_02970, partial [Patescibacteria group bacterium]
KSIEQLLNRKKLNEAVSNLQSKTMKKLTEWQSIQQLIDTSEEAELVLEGRLKTRDELVALVSKKFLTDPWNQTAEQVVSDVSEEVVEIYG